MTIHTVLFLCALGGYLLGSIPFGLVLTRMAGYGDQDLPALLDRPVGRIPEARYLSTGLPTRKD